MAKGFLAVQKDTFIATLSRANELLRNCATAEEAKKAIDAAAAARIFAERQKLGIEAQNLATEIVLRAKRHLGEILSATEKHQGGRPPAKPVDLKRHVSSLKELGITRDLSAQAQQLAAVPEQRFEGAIAEAKQSRKETSPSRILRQLIRPPVSDIKKQSAEDIEEATVILARPTEDPNEIVSTILTFIDEQLVSASEEVRIKVAQALQEYVWPLMEQKFINKPRERPYHQPGYSPEWNATDCARSLLKRFENLTARRTSPERYEVLDGFNDLARDFIDRRQGDRDAVRGGKPSGGEEGE